ncbi:MAG: hypothetical protein ACOX6Y_06865 [Christensenellales bacterium]|jgi:hypothetical protein
MNNPIKQAFDKQFSGIQMDEARMGRIRTVPVKTASPPLKKALVLAMALLIIMGAAYSASQYLGALDWQGNRTPPDKSEITPTHAPDSTAFDEEARLERLAHEALSRKPSEELWLARMGNGRWTTFFPKIRVNSLEEARELLAQSASPLRLPKAIPAEYAFNTGELSLYIDTENYDALKRLKDENPEPGLLLKGYRLPEKALGHFNGYILYFINRQGDSLRLEARMSSGKEDFGLWQGDSHQSLTIPGFENALIFEREGLNRLFARQAGFSPISACRMDYFTDAADRPDYPLEPELYSSVTYTLSNTTTSGEAASSEMLKALAGEYVNP